MKFLLVWAGLWRKPLRTTFTMLSIVTAFLLFGLLQSITASFASFMARAHADRLMTVSANFGPLPISALAKIESVPGVTGVAWIPRFAGYWQDPKNPVWPNAVD